MVSVNLGRVKPLFKGTYNPLTAYEPLDFVVFSSISYFNILASTGITPTNVAYWQPLYIQQIDTSLYPSLPQNKTPSEWVAILAASAGLLPQVTANLSLNFASNNYILEGVMTLDAKTFAEVFTHTRAGIATYTGSGGLIKTALTDVARIGYDEISGKAGGLLHEDAATNLVTYSQDFADAAWAKELVTLTVTDIAPDGTATATSINEGASSGVHRLFNSSPSITEGEKMTFSIFAKAGTSDNIRIAVTNMSAEVLFDLTLGEVTTIFGALDAGVIPMKNGWFRLWIRSDSVPTTGSVTVVVYMVDDSGGVSYAGTNRNIAIWGAQFEKQVSNYAPSSYIVTTSAAGTRAGDVLAFIEPEAIAINPTKGTLYIEYQNVDTRSGGILCGTSADGSVTYVASAAGGVGLTSLVGGVIVSNEFFAKTAIASGKFAFSYDADASVLIIASDGVVITVSGVTIESVNSLRVASAVGGGSRLSGSVTSFDYFPRALSSAELKALTS
jgi:hypothetical protein